MATLEQFIHYTTLARQAEEDRIFRSMCNCRGCQSGQQCEDFEDVWNVNGRVI